MKNSNTETLKINFESIINEIMSDETQRILYGKLMNLTEDVIEPWLQGVLELAEILNIKIYGIVAIWNAIQEHGVQYVKHIF